MDFDISQYSPVREALIPEGIVCQIHGRHQIAVSTQKEPIWPNRGNSFWITHATGRWVVGTWSPRAYELGNEGQLVDLCVECMALGSTAMFDIPAAIQRKYGLRHLDETELDEVYSSMRSNP